jgi:hypothetical protein
MLAGWCLGFTSPLARTPRPLHVNDLQLSCGGHDVYIVALGLLSLAVMQFHGWQMEGVARGGTLCGSLVSNPAFLVCLQCYIKPSDLPHW